MFIELLPGGKGSCRFSVPLGAHSPVPLRVSPATPPHRLGLRFHTRLSEDLLRFSKPSAETGTLRQSEYRRVMDWIKLGVDLIVAFLKEMQKCSSAGSCKAACPLPNVLSSSLIKKTQPRLTPRSTRRAQQRPPKTPRSCGKHHLVAVPFSGQHLSVLAMSTFTRSGL